ncbi:MAG: hypothetical protein E4G99_03340 [Anaerolineales bacterium]|nr:MAG: hypothetical protein E4G99_03340 [Anaerolineales bacterium]
MNLSTDLLIGIVLIGMGLLLGVAAYMVLSTRGERRSEPDEDLVDDAPVDEADPDIPGMEGAGLEAASAGAARAQETLEDEDLAPIPVSEPSNSEETILDDLIEPELAELPKFETVPAIELPGPNIGSKKPEPGPRIEVATLLRDEVSGKLIIKVGDHEYHSAVELRDSQDWTRMEYAASDLSKWIEQPVRRATPERELDLGERSKPMSMIEQINAILQKKVGTRGQGQLAVQLIEGPGGSARVLIGVHSYEMGEVPEESINQLIREAVADWEAGQ